MEATWQIHAVPDAAGSGSSDRTNNADALVAAGLLKVPGTGALLRRDDYAGIDAATPP
ncbi:hypothetical protein [Bradyrhizobium sp. DOA1]|uniref:hypothetical protein n=1 Tax=Bradyrhizobium sp. DOA1 TaxID=1126616 RepID=UPI000A7B640E|nr:hypothetical protein [Bradyrhizobium sp. DOA1]